MCTFNARGSKEIVTLMLLKGISSCKASLGCWTSLTKLNAAIQYQWLPCEGNGHSFPEGEETGRSKNIFIFIARSYLAATNEQLLSLRSD